MNAMSAIIDVLFVTSLVLPPVIVITGALALAWPRSARKTPTPAAHPAHA
jgi:hypothetical protein